MSVPIAVTFLVTNALMMLAYRLFMGIFFKERRTTLQVELCTYIFAYLFTSVLYFHAILLWQFLRPPIEAVLVFIISLNYKCPKVKRFAVAGSMLLLSLAGFGVESIIRALQREWSIFGEWGNRFIYDRAANYFTFATLIPLTLIFVVALFWLLFRNIQKSTIYSPKFWLTALIVPFTILISGFLVLSFGGYMVIFEGGADTYDLLHTILLGLFLTLPAFFSFGLYDVFSVADERKLRVLLYAKEKEYYAEQLRLMHESAKGLQAFKYGEKDHLAALKQLIKENPEEAPVYLERLARYIAKNETLCNTGNVVLDSIVNYKLGSTGDDIKAELNISVPPELKIEDSDMVVILGNLLDNALEAVAKVDDKYVKLAIEYGKGGLFIRVGNTFNGEVKYSKEGSITSLKEGEHGYGLRNIRQSAEKYNGNINISHTANDFSVSIFLYVN